MNVLVLNGSPKKNGTVASLLKSVAEGTESTEIEWIDVCDLEMKNCTACMKCRKDSICIFQDDAAEIGKKINNADCLIVGSPVQWGNVSAPLKLLFDRNVPVMMGESPGGLPVPRQKGKKVVIVTACTTPWPFNFIFPESRGVIAALKEILHHGGYKICGKIVKPGTKRNKNISQKQIEKAKLYGRRLK